MLKILEALRKHRRYILLQKNAIKVLEVPLDLLSDEWSIYEQIVTTIKEYDKKQLEIVW